MQEMIKVLERIGQTQSINQLDSVNGIKLLLQTENLSFDHVIKHSFDQVCMLFPEDDDDEE